MVLWYILTTRPSDLWNPEYESYDISQSRKLSIYPRRDIDNLKNIFHNVDLIEGQGTQGTRISPLP